MVKKKKYIILMLVVILIIAIQSKVNAFDVLPSLENTDLVTQEIQISLKLSDLADYKNGINVASGKLVYDHDIFEKVSFNGINGWTCAYNDQENTGNEGKFVLITTSGNLREEKEVAKINFKIKSNINNVKTTIKLESVETSYQSNTIKAEDKEINIEIKDNEVNLVKENYETEQENSLDATNIEKKDNNTFYVIIAVITIILIMFLIFIINKSKKGGEKHEQ